MKKRLWYILVGFFCLLCCKTLQAESIKNTINLESGLKSTNLTPHIQYIKPMNRALSLDEVVNTDQPWLSPNEFSKNTVFGHSRQDIWTRLTLSKPIDNNDSTYYLKFSNPLLLNLELFFFKNGQKIDYYHTGRLKNFNTRVIAHRLFLYPISLPAGEPIDVYIKYNTLGQTELELSIWQKEAFLEADQLTTVRYAFEFGVLFLLCLYSVLTYIYTHNKNYLYFSLFVLSASLNQVALSGYAYQYFLQDTIRFNVYSVFIFTSLACIFGCIFSYYFLNFKKYSPFLAKMTPYVICTFIFLIIKAILFDEQLINNSSLFMLYTAILIIGVLGISSALYLWLWKNLETAQYFLLAWLTYILLGILSILERVIDIPISMEIQSTDMSIGLALSMFIISFAIGNEIYVRKQIFDRTRKNLNQIINSIPSILVIVDEALKIKSVNAFALNRLNFQPEDLINRELKTLFFNQEDYVHLTDIIKQFSGHSGLELYYCDQKKNSIPVVFSHTQFYDTEAKAHRILCVAQDITELKKIETEKLAIQEQLFLDRRLKTIGRLTSGVSHELNNILTPISGYSELLLCDPNLSKEHQVMAEQIFDAVHRGRNIVSQILSASRGQKENIKLKNTPIVKIIEKAIEFIKAMMPGNIVIKTDLSIDQDIIILSHADSIHQILLNLCTNASHAINPRKGQITLTVEQGTYPEMGINHDQEYIRIIVEDTGHGMDEKTLNRIFEPFFTTKEVGKGTGLGLSIIYQTIKSINGYIKVESTINVGSKFFIYLPKLKEETSRNKIIVQTVKPENINILYVDDDPSVIQLMKDSLEKTGYNVTTTEYPTTALKWINENPNRFNLIISDYLMPVMNGLELAKNIERERTDIPIIFVTGGGKNVSDIINLSDKYKVIEKPIKMEVLHEAITETMNSRTYRQSI